jgi:hypothetical protein
MNGVFYVGSQFLSVFLVSQQFGVDIAGEIGELTLVGADNRAESIEDF